MRFIDTHAHLNFSDYDEDRNEVIKRTLDAGIAAINVGVEFATSKFAIELARGALRFYSGQAGRGFFAAVGLHPNYVMPRDLRRTETYKMHDYEDFDLEKYRELASASEVVAIGETGLDYSRISAEGGSPPDGRAGASGGKNDEARIKELQKDVFKKQIELAITLNKPIIIHCRKTHDDVLDILNSYFLIHNSRLRGVIHSFTGNINQSQRYRGLGFKIAFNGIITFSRDYDDVILDAPLEDILLETDCPYLTPVPYRGQRNEPSHIFEVAKKLAEIKGISYGNIISQTTANAKKLFNIV